MKTRQDTRPARVAKLPAVLLTLALSASYAAVGNAAELSNMIITAERPVHCEDPATTRNEVQARARLAVWQTRVNVGTDLGVKLNSQQNRTLRLAGNYMGKRG